MSRGTDISQFQRKYRERNEGDFPSTYVISLQREWNLKYGENPHQQGAIYFLDTINGQNASRISNIANINSIRSDGYGKGGLSLTNTMDITRAMDSLKYFNVPAVAIMKHNILSGFAKQTKRQSLADLFRLARDSDRRSNFGGTAVFNYTIDRETAGALYELKGETPFFVDVLAAPSYEGGVLSYIENQSRNIRIASFSGLEAIPKFIGDETYGLVSVKEMPTGRIGIQDVYLTAIKTSEDLITNPMVINKKTKEKYIVARDPTDQEKDDLLTAWWLNVASARSNGLVAVRNGISVSIGAGQVERVGAVEQMIVKGMQKAMDREGIKYDPLYGIEGHKKLQDQPFKNAVCASDGFFPFRDSIDLLARAGISAVVQPFGSIHDNQVIDAANEYNIAMCATLERCFGHF
ncbi:hypothetical protein HYT56_04190 [Candidatus Woesearchaeota archaeon]|nr:hypothetical protein [Candidatus Woesearchaeota archaeon]